MPPLRGLPQATGYAGVFDFIDQNNSTLVTGKIFFVHNRNLHLGFVGESEAR